LGQKSISGRVIVDFEPQPMVYISSTKNFDTILGKTDFDGYFNIETSKMIDTLFLGSVGLETAIILPNEYCETYEIIMILSSTYHFKSNAKVDRLRKRKFDELSDLHKQAAEIGLFETKTPCYSMIFETWKEDLDEIDKMMKTRTKMIKKEYDALQIGDSVRLIFSPSRGSDGTGRTILHQFSSHSDPPPQKTCSLIGKVLSKDKKKRGFNLEYSILSIDQCSNETLVLEGREIKIGDVFRTNMKVFLVLIK
jgi:hypothetical protein